MMEEAVKKTHQKINIEKILIYLFVFFCFFPYINILRIPTDAQPNALLLAVAIFLIGIKKYKYPTHSLMIILMMIPSFLVGSINGEGFNFNFFRSLLGYFSLFLITLVSYISFKKGYTLSWFWFKIFVYFNIIVSVLQTILGFNFVEFLFYRVGTSDTRGVTGLTPEPTFNATIAIFCASLYLLNYYNTKRNFILILIFIWIVILAQSSTIVLMAIPIITLYLIFKHFKFFVLPMLIIFTFAIGFLSKENDEPETSRLITILNVVASNPSRLLILDPSVNSRVSNIILPAYISILDLTLPHGSSMVVLNREIPKLKRTFPDLFYFDDIMGGIERIMSGWSMMFYEAGFFAFLFFFYTLYLVFFRLDNLGVEFLGGILFIAIVFTAVTVNTSIIPFIFGNIIYKSSIYRHKTP